MERDRDQQEANDKDQRKESATTSTVDRKNEDAVGHTATATDRVKPRSGDGLANEGTNVSYESER